MRKLATIARMDDVRCHPNADSLELATIRGWQVVVKRGEFQPGDRVVYCEIDSVMPERPEFEFLRERHFRIRTIKLRGELSQGIAFPLSILPSNLHASWYSDDGDDVTEPLGVTLYQAPIPACLGGQVEGNFPAFLRKTDSERIQNYAWLLEKYGHLEWAATEKADGSSCTVWWKDGKLHVASRNWELREDEQNAYWQAAKAAGLHEKLRDSPIALQGELLGPKIQGGRYGILKPTLYIFDAYHMEDGRYLDFIDLQIACDRLDVETVPLVCMRTRLNLSTITTLLREAEGPSDLNPKTEREGLVWKPMVETTDEHFGRVAFKVISNRFLLKQKD